ncbi:MAG: hypothetical protein ACJ8H8_27785 [Geminicoccaceae bacterium]
MWSFGCRLAGWTMLILVTACTAAPVPTDASVHVEPAAGPPPQSSVPVAPPLPWPTAASCRELLVAIVAMPEAELRRLEPAAAPIAYGVRDAAIMLSPAAAQAAVLADLPLPASAGADVHCLVLVERSSTKKAAPRRFLEHEVVQSTYQAGSERQPNPDYVALRRRLRETESDKGLGIMATGDPGLDLIGLIGGVVLNGVGAINRAQSAAAMRERLAGTPATLTSQSWEPYTFEVTTIEAARSGQLRAALVDSRSNRAWPMEREMVEQRRFRVANGRRARDRGLLEGGGADLVETADVAVWEQGGLRPSLAGLAKLLAAVDTPGIAGGLAALAPVEPLPAPATTSGRTGSVEQIVAADGVRRYRLREAEPAAAVTPEP